MRLTRRLLKSLLTPILLFVSVALGRTLVSLPVHRIGRYALLSLSLGFGTGILLFALGARFFGAYVFGHELTHWVAAKLFLKRTSRLRLGGRKGSVSVDNPNPVIVLAPYFIPVYTVLWIGLYGCLRWFVRDVHPVVGHTFLAGAGMTYAFHVVLTLYALAKGQEDLKLFGPVFSLAGILAGNLLVLLLAAVVAGRQWADAGRLLAGFHADQARAIARAAAALAGVLRSALAGIAPGAG